MTNAVPLNPNLVYFIILVISPGFVPSFDPLGFENPILPPFEDVIKGCVCHANSTFFNSENDNLLELEVNDLMLAVTLIVASAPGLASICSSLYWGPGSHLVAKFSPNIECPPFSTLLASVSSTEDTTLLKVLPVGILAPFLPNSKSPV